MKNDLSFINTEADLDRETKSAQERIANARKQLKEDAQQMPGDVLTNAAKKSMPYIAGGLTIAIGALIFRKLVGKSKNKPAATIPRLSKSSIAINSLPFILMVAKTLLRSKREKQTVNK